MVGGMGREVGPWVRAAGPVASGVERRVSVVAIGQGAIPCRRVATRRRNLGRRRRVNVRRTVGSRCPTEYRQEGVWEPRGSWGRWEARRGDPAVRARARRAASGHEARAPALEKGCLPAWAGQRGWCPGRCRSRQPALRDPLCECEGSDVARGTARSTAARHRRVRSCGGSNGAPLGEWRTEPAGGKRPT